ncbi:hypothetical protein C4K26_4097 [Pseudomonas chlororaphis]|nr:hypothetical protein C4K26_4097 [Pseudomonas chlororaphis]
MCGAWTNDREQARSYEINVPVMAGAAVAKASVVDRRLGD